MYQITGQPRSDATRTLGCLSHETVEWQISVNEVANDRALQKGGGFLNKRVTVCFPSNAAQ
jgi:hypothetical protein